MGRSTVNKVVQVGVETTPGTAVPANKTLPSLSFKIGPRMSSKSYRAQGYKYNTSSKMHRVWGEGSFDGPLSFEEIIYPLSTMFGAPTPTTPAGGTTARQWLFAPVARGADSNLKTLTIEQGDSTAAQVMTNVVAASMDFDFAQEDVTVSGDLIGRAPTTGTLTGSPTEIPQQPAGANEIDVYINTSLGALNATLFGSKVTDAYGEKFTIGRKFNPRWVHNTSYSSFRDLIEIPPDLSGVVRTEFNAQARALYDAVLLSTKQYVGIRVTGPIIEGSINYLFEIVYAAKVTATEDEDADGVYGYSFTFGPENDATLGGPFTIRVVNTRTTL